MTFLSLHAVSSFTSRGVLLASLTVLAGACGARSDLTTGETSRSGPSTAASGTGAGGNTSSTSTTGSGAAVPACTPGADLVPVFSQDQVTTVGVVADEQRIYFTAESDSGNYVYASAHDGSDLQTIASGLVAPWFITGWGDTLFWIDAGKQLYRASKDGTNKPSVIHVGESIGYVVADDTSLFVTEGGGGGRVLRMSWDGNSTEVLLDFDDVAPGSLAVDAEDLYIMTTEPDQQGNTIVYKVPKTGGPAVELAVGGAGFDAGLTMLLVDDVYVYWLAATAGKVHRVRKDGSDEAEVIADGVVATSMAQTTNHLYFSVPYSDDEIRSLWRFDKATAQTTAIIETMQYNPWSIAVAQDHLFFSSRVTTGPLMRSCR